MKINDNLNNASIYDSMGYTTTKLANIYLSMKDNDNAYKYYNNALLCFREALKLNSKHALANNSIAYIYMQLDKMNNKNDIFNEEAFKYFSDAYSFAKKDDKKLIEKCITSLAKENIKTAVDFCTNNNIEF